VQYLEKAIRMRRPGVYQIQAAIAALHDEALSPGETDWTQIASLYDRLWEATGSPVVALNRAAAFGMAQGPEAGIRRIEELEASGELKDYHLLYAAKADLLRRAARHREAHVEYGKALDLVRNERERAYLSRRRGEIEADPSG
jgi:RNA polymerase sigma-70 factor (ECF subfamily)